MQQFSGRPISPGYAKGIAYVYGQRGDEAIERYQITDADVASEHRRFHKAVNQAVSELRHLEDRVLDELGEAQSAIFAAHLGLLQDQSFIERVNRRVTSDLVNVEQALDTEVTALCSMLASVENEYIRERAQDIRDVGMRIMRQLAEPHGGHYVDLPTQSIIVARELLPSETLDLDREHVVGIVTEEGGENSHAAILARALGIPAVTGISAATTRIACGSHVLIDGENGTIVVTPSDLVANDFASLKSRYDADTATANAAENLECVTQDGTRISLMANINRPHESRLVQSHHLDGVGLFRTEFMFLESREPPDFDRQVTAYREIVGALPDCPIAIRTLDLGGDKLPAFLAPHHEANPNLGTRGLRFSLREKTMFETQVRAIVTAAQDHENVRLLLPMVLGASDLADAIELITRLSLERGFASPKIGAMIETPAALFALDEILQLAEFVCVGTNDLTQFMLAADRDASELTEDCSVLHPSVLRAIARVVRKASSAGRKICVCGEAASYPRTAGLLVGLGVRELSMSPLRAARVRYLLRESSLPQLEELAESALASTSSAAVRQLLTDLPSHLDTSSLSADIVADDKSLVRTKCRP